MVGRQLNRASIRKRHQRLHDTFTESLRSDDRRHAVILHRTGKYLRRTGGIAIYQHNHRDLQAVSILSVVCLLRALLICHGQDPSAIFQDIIRHRDNRRHLAARVVPQIDDQALHALALQFLDLGFKLISSHTVKLHNGNISDLFIQHLA